MTRNSLNNAYFEWMYRLVCGHNRYSKNPSYRKLLKYLHTIPFEYTLPMDGNRAEDGEDFRYRFGYEKSYEGPIITSYLDDRPCSVLEMLVALAFRCEEHIMDDPDIGDRTGQWFWDMIISLGLNHMTDDNFDQDYIDDVIDRFHNHEYEPDGRGGLFTCDSCGRDMRTMEIWHQMCWYLKER